MSCVSNVDSVSVLSVFVLYLVSCVTRVSVLSVFVLYLVSSVTRVTQDTERK
jgi:hypothetical protein